MNRLPPSLRTYLWAAGATAAQWSPPNVIEGRYKVIHPQVWQDVYPEQLPAIPNPLPAELVAYLHLYPQHRHIPSVYGVCYLEGEPIILLQEAPLDREGRLLPALFSAWAQASALRQVSWLWQVLQLWEPLTAQGVAVSLLDPENLRVEGGCLRLRELSFAAEPATLAQLGQTWTNLARAARAGVADKLGAIATELQRPDASLSVASKALNKLLLIQTAHHPLRSRIASATDPGPQQERNEDTCYPRPAEGEPLGDRASGSPAAPFAIVCDGIGGHEGGEVASQLAVQSLQLQVQALLGEISRERELLSPEQVADHLKAVLRIANNLICSRNDAQGREARQRMATTVVMAVQVQQAVPLNDSDFGTSHELYLLHVGDSRAYWLTEHYCQQLTVDDDVASREIRLGRSLPSQAQRRPDAEALTQALGMREAERLRPTIQRFTLDEDGILLLCSDGLSDHQLLERSWQEFVPDILKGKLSLAMAAELWVKLANQRNGHDNTTVVTLHYRLDLREPVVVPRPEPREELPTPSTPTPAARSPEPEVEPDLDLEPEPQTSPSPPQEPDPLSPAALPRPFLSPAPELGDSNGSPPASQREVAPPFVPMTAPEPREESPEPLQRPSAFFEDVDTESEEENMSDEGLEGRYRQVALGAGAGLLALVVLVTGWYVWSQLNPPEPRPLPGPNQEQPVGD